MPLQQDRIDKAKRNYQSAVALSFYIYMIALLEEYALQMSINKNLSIIR